MKVAAKRYAIYSLQFFIGKDKTLNMTETANEGELNHSDMYLHGLHVEDSKLLDEKDKEAMAAFCEAYLSRYKSNRKS